MATYQKFKALVAGCATARSPTRGHAASGGATCLNFRRRKTLKSLLVGSPIRGIFRWRVSGGENPMDLVEKKELISRHSLKDLFVASPPPSEGDGGGNGISLQAISSAGEVFGGGMPRFRSAGLRWRLLRAASRPGLFTIPE